MHRTNAGLPDLVADFKIPPDATFILQTLENAGFEAFVVGGCVRDALRGVAPSDMDIATAAEPHAVKRLFSRTIDTGIKHGTVTVLFDGRSYEVTTFRLDGEYLDGRRPESVTFARGIEDDLARRDFSVNAIAYSPTRGFVDPFDGRGDITRGVIRCVGDAECRFSEDALRMLRAIRFSATLGFSVDNAALAAISKLKENLKNVSAERVREELVKLLAGENLPAIKLLEETGLMPQFGDLDEKISHLRELGDSADTNMRVALFLRGLDYRKILHELRFDNRTIKTVATYLDFLPKKIPLDRYEIKKFMRVIPFENFQKLLELKAIVCPDESTREISDEARDILAKNECYTLRGLAVNGDDLAAAGMKRGAEMGAKLERLLDAVMREPHKNERATLLCL